MGAYRNIHQTNDRDEPENEQLPVSRPLGAVFILLGGTLILLFGAALSIVLGAADIKLSTVWNALFHFDSKNTAHQIIWELRLPRTVSAILVGACLAVSGAIMQGMTRNPLASPEIMSVTDGSAFAVAVAFAFFPGISSLGLLGWSFAGAGLGAAIVFAVGMLSKGGLTPVKLALAGTAVGTLLRALSSAIAIHFDVARDVSFWYAGGIAGMKWSSVELLAPAAALGLVLVFFIARSVTILSLGEEVAKGLGQSTKTVKVIGVASVVLLTGAAVSVAGTIGFIGLIIPHIARFLAGVDYRWIIPCSAVLGAVLLLCADICARMINPPFETPVGAVTALVGVPFFLYLARREGRGL
ncbi:MULTISPECIES: FecCD family ABC transporter permease [Bacillus]|uniref:FecCD family ABC transporter permease n=1 Tax=Bacillus TaxID=1386 RepID=UPI0015840877|nr:iron ABC transporter permease [Bacillus glycinifermentans]MBU8785528.1 iron chelate uptake ABC transporter family permease subunit [Bacillus glycinifermentans]NUJ15847.1 iron ABC transporter permease [Bacillus glycinifermentans]